MHNARYHSSEAKFKTTAPTAGALPRRAVEPQQTGESCVLYLCLCLRLGRDLTEEKGVNVRHSSGYLTTCPGWCKWSLWQEGEVCNECVRDCRETRAVNAEALLMASAKHHKHFPNITHTVNKAVPHSQCFCHRSHKHRHKSQCPKKKPRCNWACVSV